MRNIPHTMLRTALLILLFLVVMVSYWRLKRPAVESVPNLKEVAASSSDVPVGEPHSDELEQLYSRYNLDVENVNLRLNVDAFTAAEYDALIDAAIRGDIRAFNLLKASIFRHLLRYPEDEKFSKYKPRLYSREFVQAVPFTEISASLPAGLLHSNIELAQEILKEDPDNFKLFPTSLRSKKELILAGASSDLSILKFVPVSVLEDKEFTLELCGIGPEVLEYIPVQMRDKGFVRVLLEQHPEYYGYVQLYIREAPEVLPVIRNLLLKSNEPLSVPMALGEDEELIKTLLKKNPKNLEMLPDSSRCNKKLLMKFIENNPERYLFLCESLQNDPEVLPFIREKIRENPGKYANNIPTKLRADKEFVFPIIKQRPDLYSFFSSDFQNEPELLPGIRAYLLSARWVSSSGLPERLRGDKEVAMHAVTINCHTLLSLTEELRDDEEVVSAAVDRSQDCLKHASSRLQKKLAGTRGKDEE